MKMLLFFAAVVAYILLGIVVVPKVMNSEDVDVLETSSWRKQIIIVGIVMLALAVVTEWMNMLSILAVPAIIVAGFWPVLKKWHQVGDEFVEWAAFFGMVITTTIAAALTMPHLVAVVALFSKDNAIIANLLRALPWLAMVLAGGWMAADALEERAETASTTEAVEAARSRKKWVVIGTIILVVFMLLIPTVMGLAKPAAKADDNKKKTEDQTTVVAGRIEIPAWITFYHQKVVEKDQKNTNFGPAAPANSAKAAEDELWKRLEKDPALYAAIAGWVDAKFGTSFLEGAQITAAKAQQGRALDVINIGVREYTYNGTEAEHKARVARLKAFLKTGKSEIARKSVKSQMYMTGYHWEVPVVVVSEGNPTEVPVLVFKLSRGGQTGEVWLKLDCGYQPCTNEAVSKQLNVKPTPIEKVTNNVVYRPGGGTTPSPSPSPSPGPGPGPTPTPTPGYDKDPAKAPSQNTEPNDNPGPGPNTNNGAGSNYSAVDTPDSSSHETYNEYVEWNGNGGQMEVINDNQQTGGSGGNNPTNTPTYTPETPPAAVDNNGNNGVGWGGADDPTPATKPPITPPGEVGQPWTPNW